MEEKWKEWRRILWAYQSPARKNLAGTRVDCVASEAQLMSRAMTDKTVPGLASSFFDRATAEAAASQALDANASKIADWLAASKGRTLKIYGSLDRAVGKIVTKEGISVTTSSSVFVLVPDATSPMGYYILSGYPKTY